jgi:hypothetical protein
VLISELLAKGLERLEDLFCSLLLAVDIAAARVKLVGIPHLLQPAHILFVVAFGAPALHVLASPIQSTAYRSKAETQSKIASKSSPTYIDTTTPNKASESAME